jgi:hypothetical protein
MSITEFQTAALERRVKKIRKRITHQKADWWQIPRLGRRSRESRNGGFARDDAGRLITFDGQFLRFAQV